MKIENYPCNYRFVFDNNEILVDDKFIDSSSLQRFYSSILNSVDDTLFYISEPPNNTPAIKLYFEKGQCYFNLTFAVQEDSNGTSDYTYNSCDVILKIDNEKMLNAIKDFLRM